MNVEKGTDIELSTITHEFAQVLRGLEYEISDLVLSAQSKGDGYTQRIELDNTITTIHVRSVELPKMIRFRNSVIQIIKPS